MDRLCGQMGCPIARHQGPLLLFSRRWIRGRLHDPGLASVRFRSLHRPGPSTPRPSSIVDQRPLALAISEKDRARPSTLRLDAYGVPTTETRTWMVEVPLTLLIVPDTPRAKESSP
jgi:hypothetical protein